MTGRIQSYSLYNPATDEWSPNIPILLPLALVGGVRATGMNQFDATQMMGINIVVSKPDGTTQEVEGQSAPLAPGEVGLWELWFDIDGQGDYPTEVKFVRYPGPQVEFIAWYICWGDISAGTWSPWMELTDGMVIPSGYDVALNPAWRNMGPDALLAHVDLTITKPDGTTETPEAYRNNDLLWPVGYPIPPVFRFSPGASGNYNLKVELYGNNELLDTQVTWLVVEQPSITGLLSSREVIRVLEYAVCGRYLDTSFVTPSILGMKCWPWNSAVGRDEDPRVALGMQWQDQCAADVMAAYGFDDTNIESQLRAWGMAEGQFFYYYWVRLLNEGKLDEAQALVDWWNSISPNFLYEWWVPPEMATCCGEKVTAYWNSLTIQKKEDMWMIPAYNECRAANSYLFGVYAVQWAPITIDWLVTFASGLPFFSEERARWAVDHLEDYPWT